MSAETKTRRIKLIFGIIIPVLVLVTTIVMVSMSFAWFSTETNASIQSINLATQKAFVLDFSSGGATSDNLKYRGQEAIDSVQQLVSPFSTQQGDKYTVEAPYFFISPVKISTGGEKVNLHLGLEGVKITTTTDVVLDTYIPGVAEGKVHSVAEGKEHSASEIPLAFTWFFKEHPSDGFNDGVLVPTLNKKTTSTAGVAEEEMDPYKISPKAGETWYTPYGTMEFSETTSKLEKINGETYSVKSFSSDILNSTVDIKNFSADDDAYFDFYIIFAPEKLFWSHIFKGNDDYTTKANDLYKEDQQKAIYGDKFFEEKKYAMYYSEQAKYQGAHFKFGAVLNVTEIVGAGTDDPSGNP